MNNQQVRKNRRYEFWRWRIFFITWLAYAGFYLTRKSFAVAKIGLAGDSNILMSKTVMGKLDFIYLTAYAIGQFIFGIFGDRFGTRKIILAGMLCSVIVGFAMGLSSIFLLFGVLMCIQGLCQSTGWAPLTKNISYWFSQRERGVVVGCWCTNYALGGFIAALLAGYAVDYFYSWRYAFFVPAAVLFGIWILFLVLQKNRPEDVGLPPIEEYHGEKQTVLAVDERLQEEPEGSWKTIFEVLKNPMVLLLGGVYFFLKPTRYAILFWSPLYVSEKLGTGTGQSALIGNCFDLAGPAGVILGGYISDKLFRSRRIPVCVICLIALAVVLFSFNHLADYRNKWLIAGLFFAIGFLLYAPDSLVSATSAIDFGTQKGASTAVGLINFCGSTGAILGGTLPGVISERWGWRALFIMLGISVCLAAVLILPKWNALPATADGTSNSKT